MNILFTRGLQHGLNGAGLSWPARGWRLCVSCAVLLAMLATWVMPGVAHAAHAVAYFGDPKYPADFTHFDYVNPNAPKRGTLNLSHVVQHSSFDKFNPFTLRGKPAPGVLELMFETLTVHSLDEPSTQYGLLAEDIEVAPDFSWVKFRLHPKARFNNGDPVTAQDVKQSFNVLTGRKASPRFKSYFADIDKLVVLDARTVRFEFKRKGRDLPFVAGSLPVFSPKWGRLADGSTTPFEELKLEKPVTSGPYVVERSASGQNVVFTRNPKYWAQDLPVRRGAFNFDRVVYKLYKDKDTLVSAIRAGDFDFYPENKMRYWCCQFIGSRFDSGELIKAKVLHGNPAPMNGYVFNLRRPQFQDVRVRKALNLVYDWEWLNRMVLDDEFDRQDSYFSNTPLAAKGLPSPAELALLEPYRNELVPAVFGPMLAQPKTVGASSIRQNMVEALKLLADAGWKHQGRVLRNSAGQALEIEVSDRGGLLESYYYNLRKLGVVVKTRTPDAALERQRLRKFDFDFTRIGLREARLPGPELLRNFHSSQADVEGSENVAGVRSPAVDALIEKLLEANSQQELETVAHALDRVLMHHHYVLPWRYLRHQYFIHHQRLKRPDVVPRYFAPNEWVLGAWWDDGSPRVGATGTEP
ncbi:MAG: ABC transporter substrate-binding protein [Rhizobacter sp.]